MKSFLGNLKVSSASLRLDGIKIPKVMNCDRLSRYHGRDECRQGASIG